MLLSQLPNERNADILFSIFISVQFEMLHFWYTIGLRLFHILIWHVRSHLWSLPIGPTSFLAHNRRCIDLINQIGFSLVLMYDERYKRYCGEQISI